MPLPTPTFETPAEPFASPWGERECDQTPKPGVEAFAKFVVEHQGGRYGRIVGPCGVRSGHASGRAFDWMIEADLPDERQAAEELLKWLLARDAEMFRRAGLRYVIWDRQIFSSRSPAWRPYDGYDASGACPSPPCRHPHRNHVHFSFSREGAAGQTSFYAWLRDGAPAHPQPPAPTPGAPKQASAASLWWTALGAIFGFGAVLAYNRRR